MSSLFARQPSSNFCYNFSKTAFRGALWQNCARKKSTPSTSNFACFDTRGKIFIANSRRTTEKRKGKWKDDANTIENFENFGKKKIQETIIGTNEYVQRIFIRIENLFMRVIFRKIVHFFQKASLFGIFCFAANLVEER